ncbi:MAG: hypothetical protein L0221_11910, partial [Chloroflexi bacterium]|nr:hypothetical protein [Chloroflexota bacterium]
DAACHAWTVKASPSSAAEGAKVTVTVSRDAAVNPSDIHVSTIDESAQAPADFTKLDEQVELTSETSRTLSITIADDAAAEGAETFRVHLSDPGGCAVNPNYQIAPDVRVTIQASDQVAATTQPPSATQPASRRAVSTPTPSSPLSPSPTATSEVTPTSSPTFSPLVGAEEEDDDGGFPAGAVVGIVLGVLAIAGGAGLLWYRRRTA